MSNSEQTFSRVDAIGGLLACGSLLIGLAIGLYFGGILVPVAIMVGLGVGSILFALAKILLKG